MLGFAGVMPAPALDTAFHMRLNLDLIFLKHYPIPHRFPPMCYTPSPSTSPGPSLDLNNVRSTGCGYR